MFYFYSSQIKELCRENANSKSELKSFKAERTILLKKMNNHARKFITAPAVRINSREDPVKRDDMLTISLVQCPHTLWPVVLII